MPLTIHLERKEYFDEINEQFVYIGPKEEIDFTIEHTLHSVYEWEVKHHKPFPFNNEKEATVEEILDYISEMVISDEKIKTEWLYALSESQVEDVKEYLENPMTGIPYFGDEKKKTKEKHVVTAELVFYWMTALNIPFECQYWNFNRLMNLIKVCAMESDPDRKKKKKKFTSSEMADRKARMDAARAKNKH